MTIHPSAKAMQILKRLAARGNGTPEEACEKLLERIASVAANHPATCPNCGGVIEVEPTGVEISVLFGYDCETCMAMADTTGPGGAA